jgi:hypothetical protein
MTVYHVSVLRLIFFPVLRLFCTSERLQAKFLWESTDIIRKCRKEVNFSCWIPGKEHLFFFFYVIILRIIWNTEHCINRCEFTDHIAVAGIMPTLLILVMFVFFYLTRSLVSQNLLLTGTDMKGKEKYMTWDQYGRNQCPKRYQHLFIPYWCQVHCTITRQIFDARSMAYVVLILPSYSILLTDLKLKFLAAMNASFQYSVCDILLPLIFSCPTDRTVSLPFVLLNNENVLHTLFLWFNLTNQVDL